MFQSAERLTWGGEQSENKTSSFDTEGATLTLCIRNCTKINTVSNPRRLESSTSKYSRLHCVYFIVIAVLSFFSCETCPSYFIILT
jgi:hypothetical protein